MRPNTILMQELIRLHCDEYIELKESGEKVDTPYIFSVRKGESVIYA
jgi:hypothetical protein